MPYIALVPPTSKMMARLTCGSASGVDGPVVIAGHHPTLVVSDETFFMSSPKRAEICAFCDSPLEPEDVALIVPVGIDGDQAAVHLFCAKSLMRLYLLPDQETADEVVDRDYEAASEAMRSRAGGQRGEHQ